MGLARYFSFKNFQQYLLNVELEKVGLMAEAAVAYYSEDNGWESLRRNRRKWMAIIASGRGEDEPSESRLREAPPDHPPLPHDLPPRASGRPGHPPPPGQAYGEPLRLGSRICLLDKNKRRVQGVRAPLQDLSLTPVKVGGDVVGWIGIVKEVELSLPKEIDFIRQQSRALYLIGAVILALSVIMSIFLARSMLRPITLLASGARKIAHKDFQARIPVERSDELGRLAADFNDMASRLEQYDEIQKQWISDISHELRTPLSVLIGSIEAIQDGVRKPDEKTIAMLHAKAIHLRKLTDDLHDLSMTESYLLQIKLEAIDIKALAIDALGRFKERTEREGMKTSLTVDGKGPFTVEGDRDRLTQVFSNLIKNSLVHTDMPGILEIKLENIDDDVVIYFEDSAPGAPDELLPRLFDRLFRIDSSRNSLTGGSGLGLSICKSIIESHGGAITARSSTLGGLGVEIRLPFAAAVHADRKGEQV